MTKEITYIPAKKISFGDTIGLFSPSEPLANDRPLRLKKSLEKWSGKYKTKFSNNALREKYYQAGSRSERLDDIRELVLNSEISALFGTWGGKSCNQLINDLPYEEIVSARKAVAGFSDVCVLLNAITARTGLITFSGPNVAGKLQESSHFDLDLIRGEAVEPFGNLGNWDTINEGVATGRLFGGNLSTFVLGLAGWAYFKNIGPKVFFWESASETPQIIDQHLYCLINSGFFDNVQAMIVGDVTYKEEKRKDRPLNECLKEFASILNIPVIKLDNFGHKPLENPIIPIGGKVHVDSSNQTIKLLESVIKT